MKAGKLLHLMQRNIPRIDRQQQYSARLRTWQERTVIAGRAGRRNGDRVVTGDFALVKDNSIEDDFGRDGQTQALASTTARC